VIALLATVVAAIILADPSFIGAQGAQEAARERDAAGQQAGAAATAELARRQQLEAGIAWHRSRAIGLAYDGKLSGGVLLPEEGVNFFSWDGRYSRRSNPPDRRWGTSGLVRTILEVCGSYAAADQGAPRCAIGDLSRERGGPFGRRYGGDGHRSHQNGLDVDVYYPRLDRAERAPAKPSEIDRALAQDLVDRFVAAGAEKVFVGPATGLRGPRDVVQQLTNHDDHMHVRLPAALAAKR
jgi:murein endopeptidase